MTRDEYVAAVKEVTELMSRLYVCKELYTPRSDRAEEATRKLLVLEAEHDQAFFAEWRKRGAKQLREKIKAFLEETEER